MNTLTVFVCSNCGWRCARESRSVATKCPVCRKSVWSIDGTIDVQPDEGLRRLDKLAGRREELEEVRAVPLNVNRYSYAERRRNECTEAIEDVLKPEGAR